MKKILVIINKNWETEPVLNALTNPKLRPAALPFPEVINTPCDGDNRMSQPRAVFSLPREGEEPLQVVVRCIEDLMATGVNTSSSLEKYKVLPQAIAADAADLIISVSTANYPDPAVTHNGTVILGGNFFIHDGNPDSHAYGNPNGDTHGCAEPDKSAQDGRRLRADTLAGGAGPVRRRADDAAQKKIIQNASGSAA